MAIGKKTGGRDFQPGEVANPSGRTPLPPALKESKRLNKTTLEEIINKYLWDSEAAARAAEDAKTPPVERWLVAIIAKGLATGDWSGFEWIAQRLVGKVKEQIEHTQPVPFVVKHLDGSRTELGAKVDKKENE